MPTLTLTPKLADQIAKAVANGVPLETAAIASGLRRAAIYDWLQAAESGSWPSTHTPVTRDSLRLLTAFSDQIQRARAEWEAKQIAAISEAAQQVNAKTGIREWRAGAWLLNNHPVTRERYREHRQTTIEQTGTIHHSHQLVRQLTDAQLVELEQQALVEQQALPEGTSGLDR